MNELALFAGAGGGILGGKLLGWRTVCTVEIEPYAASVLCQRQNDGILPPFPIWDDICTFDGNPWRGIVDVVSGGFPCQDISAAGKGAGIDGERSGLWKEMARVVREVRPRYVFVENSPMLTIRGLNIVLGDLAAMGYNAEWGVIGADDVGAPHIRKRIWILAHSPQHGRIARGHGNAAQESERRESDRGCFYANVADSSRILEGRPEQRPKRERAGAGGESINVPDADQGGRDGRAGRSQRRREESAVVCGNANEQRLEVGQSKPGDDGKEQQAIIGTDWWLSEPDVGRVVDELADRLDISRKDGQK